MTAILPYVIGAVVLSWAAWRRFAKPGATSASVGRLPPPPRTLTLAELDAALGPLPWKPVEGDDSAISIDPAWTAANLVQVEIPQLRGVKGAPADGRVTLHRRVAPQVVALFDAWEKAGLRDRIVLWAGSFAPRRIRGKTSVSRHAFAAAFDINAEANALGKPPAPAGAPGSVVELVPLAVAHGFTWGGYWKGRPDGMHFEIATLDRPALSGAHEPGAA